jgi:LysM repeat protein
MDYRWLRFGSRLVLLVCLLAFLAPSVVMAQDTIHVVQPGENLYRISLRYNVTVAAIAQANNIANTTRIYAGQRLVIPDLSRAVETSLFAGDPTYHVVQRGETLANIANRYGLTVQQLVQINNISNPNRIQAGETLTVFAPPPGADPYAAVQQQSASNPAPPLGASMYTVQAGETLADIAIRHGITWPTIVQANSISDPNSIYPGQMLIIPQASTVTDLGIISPTQLHNAPQPTVTSGKQIIVSLSNQRIYAYENGQLVRTTLASTGLPATPTVLGNFTVQRKYESQTMSGPGYYLPNVQWVSYFYAGYAIHGTYWHNNFGQPMSRGCVNLTNEEARWYYDFAPIGTPVTVIA